MRTRTWMSGILAAVAAASLGATCDRSTVSASFRSTGLDLDATGFLSASLTDRGKRVVVGVEGLDPNATYEVVVDDIPELMVATDSDGSATLDVSGSEAFDIRWSSVVLRDGSEDILAMDLTGSDDPSDLEVRERTFLAPTTMGMGQSARVDFRIDSDGRRTLKVEIQNVPAGDYSLFVGGILRATIPVGPVGGQVEFDSTGDPGKLLLDFDPRAEILDIALGQTLFFSGTTEGQVSGMNACVFSEQEDFLMPVGAGVGGKGKARLRTREDCDRDLRVEIEDVPEGSYAVCVDGLFRGVLDARFDTGSGEVEGSVTFDTDPDETGELLLDFEPSLSGIDVVADDGIASSGDPCPATAPFFLSGDPVAGQCVDEEVEVFLAESAGVGKAKARRRTRDDCDMDLRIEIEEVPEGDYVACVGGVLRGTITAAFVPTEGEVEGEIQFDTDPDEPDEVPLDFAIDLDEIEIREPDGSSGVGDPCPPTALVFSGSEAGGAPQICDSFEAEVPLFNSGVDSDAKGKARFRVESDCDRDFRVEVEDLPIGEYALEVDGEVRGAISVAFDPVSGEIEGQIEFDSDPDEAGELPFPEDLDPRGREVAVSQGGVDYLSRIFPD